MDFKELAQKKVFNIPVIYIAAAAVLALAYFAWKMKTSKDSGAEDPGTEPDAGIDDQAASVADAYSGLNSTGTVTVVQGGTKDDEEAVKQSNEDWATAAIKWLVANKKATATEAQSAIDHYLSGNDLSYDEANLVNLVRASSEIGEPPEKVAIGNVGTVAPAQKQFSNYPGKHTVKGSNDNTAAKLGQLYYGSGDSSHANRIAASNVSLGPVGTTYIPGTVVVIPAWIPPKFYTVTGVGDVRASQVGSKNGVVTGVIRSLNPGLTEPYKKGTKVRVV